VIEAVTGKVYERAMFEQCARGARAAAVEARVYRALPGMRR